MILTDILRAILLENEDDARVVLNSYSKSEIFNVLKNSRIRNHFLRIGNYDEEKILDYLGKVNKEFSFKNLYVKNLSKQLFSHGINHIVFKGAYMSDYYQNYSDRPFSDADILIDNKCYKNFYSFLDKNSFSHNLNYKYLNRIGYTRTALEVISTEILTLDFHYRIDGSILKKQCNFTKNIFNADYNKHYKAKIGPEFMLALVLHHSIRNNNLRTGPYYLVDIKKLLNSNIDVSYLNQILKDVYLLEEFEFTKNLIKRICDRQQTIDDSRFINKLFQYEISNSIFPTTRSLLSQALQIVDPLPYVNYSGGNITSNKYLEFIKQKFKRGRIRIK